MKKYIAFLRGINISGRNKIEMAILKQRLLAAGFLNVSTYLNSGNISFVYDGTDARKSIEEVIRKEFGLEIPVYVISRSDLVDILEHAPSWWGSEDKEWYDNLIFILTDDSPASLCELIGEVSAGLEKMEIYGNYIFWSFKRKDYQKCNWWKHTAASGIGERMTIRTVNTLRRVLK